MWKILIKKYVVYGVFGLALTIVFGVMDHSFFVRAETNTVSVEACENAGGGVRINRGGLWSTLTNGCRDAGHGYRNYQLQCVSEKSYQVSWQSCSGPVLDSIPVLNLIPVQYSAPISNSIPEVHQHVEVSEPVISELPTQTITQQNIQQPIVNQIISQPPPQSTTQTIECNGHGWLHGDHCHCDSGYYPSGTQCLAIPNTQTIAESVVSQPVPAQAISQPTLQPNIQAVECNGHGWLHGDHCHCDSGYYPSGAQCLVAPSMAVQNPIQTHTQQPVNIVTVPDVAKKNSAPTPKVQTNTITKTVPSVPKSLECNGHGWLHEDHCHCDTGYIPSGFQCLSVSGTLAQKNKPVEKKPVVQIIENKNLDIVNVGGFEEKNTERNPKECGGHGWLHGDHCHCEDGYFENAGVCLAVPAAPMVRLKNNANYSAEDFWSPRFKVNWYHWENKIVISWIEPKTHHDGYFLYLRVSGFPGNLSDYDPIILPRYRQSYTFRPDENGEYVSYVIPFVYLANGQPRALGGGEYSRYYLESNKVSFTEKIMDSINTMRVVVAAWISPE